MVRNVFSTVLAATAAALFCVGPVAASPDSLSTASASTGAPEVRRDSSELVSVRASGRAPNRWQSDSPAVNDTGQFVTFRSRARSLVPGSGRPHHRDHIYLRDLATGTTSVVDARPDGQFGNGTSSKAESTMSADGRFVAFTSTAGDLAPGGLRRFEDVFLRDMQTGTTTLVSHAADGGPANGDATEAAISADGSTIVFASEATNMIAGETPRRRWSNVFRYDVGTGETTLVSRTPSGDYPEDFSDQPTVSADGMRVVYYSQASGIVPEPAAAVIRYEVADETSHQVIRGMGDQTPDGYSGSPSISSDGTVVVYDSYASNLVPGDTNGTNDIFRYDIAADETTMISRASDGGPVDGSSLWPSVDAHGDLVAYVSGADDIVDGDRNSEFDVFVYDRDSGATTLISHNPDGQSSNDFSQAPSFAGTGPVLAYISGATDLVPGTRRENVRVYAYHF